MAKGYSYFMVHVDAGRHLKLGHMSPAERCAWTLGVLAIAAKARDRGTFTVGDRPADAADVALQANVPKAVATSTLKKARSGGLLVIEDGIEVVHDFNEHNPAPKFTSDVTAARRQALHRNVALRTAIRERDGDRCRYCGVVVAWSDRRSPAGGTYDHVNPIGENSLENLVVACRSCNSKKGDRTPQQAGMDLLPICSGVTPEQIRADEVEGEEEEKIVVEENAPATSPPEGDLSAAVAAGAHPASLPEVVAIFAEVKAAHPALQIEEAALSSAIRSKANDPDCDPVAAAHAAAAMVHAGDARRLVASVLLLAAMDRQQANAARARQTSTAGRPVKPKGDTDFSKYDKQVGVTHA